MASQLITQSGSNGRLTFRPAPDEGLVPTALDFIRSQLPKWRDDPRRPRVAPEKGLNSSLCDFLDTHSRTYCPMVRFKHEDPQGQSRTVDVGVHGMEEITLVGTYAYTIYEPFMAIEAKRLPTPGKDREREYVTGTNKANGSATGGIQRFKLGLHGAKVEIAAIVGYIEERSADDWHTTINHWINDLADNVSTDGCVWSHADVLQDLVYDNEQGTSLARSNHHRTDCLTDAIRIHHLWVEMGFGRK